MTVQGGGQDQVLLERTDGAAKNKIKSKGASVFYRQSDIGSETGSYLVHFHNYGTIITVLIGVG